MYPYTTQKVAREALGLQEVAPPIRIGNLSHEAFVEEVRRFHGYAAPGVVIGGYMVELARQDIPDGVLFDAVCESAQCLADAIQLLTPCTVGNGWLRIRNFGIFALSLYDKHTGQGRRVHLDVDKLGPYPEIKAWFLKEKTKAQQDSDRLAAEIEQAGMEILSARSVKIRPELLGHKGKGAIVRCPLCGSAYPATFGVICRSCQGESPYCNGPGLAFSDSPPLAAVPVAEAVGLHALHDMTRVDTQSGLKGAAVRAGQKLDVTDINLLKKIGRTAVYVTEDAPRSPEWLHEDAAAGAFGEWMAGPGVMVEGPPHEGKVGFLAERDGLFVCDIDRLERFNLLPGVMCATRRTCSLVRQGTRVAGSRAIPLYLPRGHFEQAEAALASGPLLRVLPLRRAKIGLLVTGYEVYSGLIEDKFAPLIRQKAEQLGSEILRVIFAPDDAKRIAQGVTDLLKAGADLIVTTAGMSVDPGDVTRQGLSDAGLTDAIYGLPVLPGAMTLVGRIESPKGEAQVLGVPAGALHRKTTALDMVLPRLLAGLRITRADVAKWGNGGLCLQCNTCRFPKCPFLH
jgi:formylmethanofuran dehydrogenase subunit E